MCITKKEIEFKLKIINQRIEMKNDLIKSSKKDYIKAMGLGIAGLILTAIMPSFKSSINSIDVISISLIVSSLHRLLFDNLRRIREFEDEVAKLESDKMYYEVLLKNLY